MLADMVMCESCRRRPEQYTSYDPDSLVCRSPCQTETRPDKRHMDTSGASHSASKVAMSERPPTSVSVNSLGDGETTATTRRLAELVQRVSVSESDDSPLTTLREQVTGLDGENSPSELEENPRIPRSGVYAWIVTATLWMGMVAVDISAWLWYTWDVLATSCGKPPPRCKVQYGAGASLIKA